MKEITKLISLLKEASEKSVALNKVTRAKPILEKKTLKLGSKKTKTGPLPNLRGRSFAPSFAKRNENYPTATTLPIRLTESKQPDPSPLLRELVGLQKEISETLKKLSNRPKSWVFQVVKDKNGEISSFTATSE